MAEVLVSVIMGIYNPNTPQLAKAIQSIINQSFTDWEMIVYDDGSDYDERVRLEKLVKVDSRISFYRGSRNRGLASVLNQCIDLAKGKYIARMDADDISLKERLRRQVDFLENNLAYDWVGTNAYLFAGETLWGARRMNEMPQAEDFLEYSPYIHPSVMFRREVLESSGGYNTSTRTRRCEDYELFIRLHRAGYHGYNLQEWLLAYREDEHSYLKRTPSSRFYEAQVRYWGFKELGILKLTTIQHVIRPIIGALMPMALLHRLKRMRWDRERSKR